MLELRLKNRRRALPEVALQFIVAVVSLATMFMCVAIWRAVIADNVDRTWGE